jgi:hypothetical protein
MTAKEARAQLVELLAEQYRLIVLAGVDRGAQARADDSARFVANGIEILRLAQVADLSAARAPAPSVPPPAIHVPVAFNAQAIAVAEARLERIETEQQGRWMDHARALRGEIELAKAMSRPDGAATNG